MRRISITAAMCAAATAASLMLAGPAVADVDPDVADCAKKYSKFPEFRKCLIDRAREAQEAREGNEGH
ncbi:hypothetical protein [Nocardia ninae]|uniref:Uncharacterized protein n=1 Tax=Nocardia ninae NBRC 108245 TaxID=1210091 RepID=A0A511MNW0_9NOCA|nr:hypothetical protein [Nocardia ninae]GEM42141.1 hypothetical protein NN4_66600 [Nocardia ninae NBRC 108245]